MARTVSTQIPRVFPPVGRCIYCGSDGGGNGLSREHVVPIGLGGGLILPRASCKVCQDTIRDEVETECLRKLIYPFRKHVGFARHKNDLPKAVPLTFDLDVRGPRRVLASEHPKVVILPRMTNPAGKLCGGPPRNPIAVNYEIFAAHEIREKIQARLARSNRVGILFAIVPWARMLAKIAHGLAVAELGLESFDPDLLDLILGRDVSTASYFVGEAVHRQVTPSPPPAHEMGWTPMHCANRWLAVVHIRLFSDLGPQAPGYSVVAGEITSLEKLIQLGLREGNQTYDSARID
jgi:hypothetical protein